MYLFQLLCRNDERLPVGEELDQHLEGSVQNERTGVGNVFQDEEAEHTDDVVPPGGKVGDDVL